MEGGADMCFGVFRQPSAPCVSVGTAVCALSLKICIRLSVRVCMCVCVCVRNRKRRNNQLCVCVHASVSACVKSATLSICLNRGLLSQFSSLWTMLVLEGDRLHKLSLTRPHTHTHTHTHTHCWLNASTRMQSLTLLSGGEQHPNGNIMKQRGSVEEQISHINTSTLPTDGINSQPSLSSSPPSSLTSSQTPSRDAAVSHDGVSDGVTSDGLF